MGIHLKKTVNCLGDLYDHVGVLDKVTPPRVGHKENPLVVEDSGDEGKDEVKREEPELKVGEDKGKRRADSRTPPRSRGPRMTGEGPRGRPQALDWLEDIPGPQRKSEVGPIRGQRARRGRPYSQ
jgi:hypothetical protein